MGQLVSIESPLAVGSASDDIGKLLAVIELAPFLLDHILALLAVEVGMGFFHIRHSISSEEAVGRHELELA